MTVNLGGDGDLHLHGAVGDYGFGDYFTASEVLSALEGASGPVRVRLNSGGGSASEGAAIYSALKEYAEEVTVYIEGIAASAASLIAMAGDDVVMGPGAMMMVHDPRMMTYGDADAHIESASLLGKFSESYAGIYAEKTGRTLDDVRAIMKAETWMSGDEAVRDGFADRTNPKGGPVSASSFPYGRYKNAPNPIMACAPVAESNKKPECVEIGLSAGRNQENPVENKMENTKETATAAPTANKDAAGIDAAVSAAVKAERERSSGIRMAAEAVGLVSMADGLIHEGATLEEAQSKLIAACAEKGAPAFTDKPKARVEMIRDEKETMREGMISALVAQADRTSPKDDRARPYMGMSIVEMAGHCLGGSASARTLSDKTGVLAQASHSRDDFPAIFEGFLNKSLVTRYQAFAPTFKTISRNRDFVNFQPHSLVSVGSMPMLQPVGEGGEIKYGTFGSSKETAALVPYAVAMRVSRQMLVDDDLGAISDMIGDYASSVAQFEEKTFYQMMASATLSNGKTVFHADHKNLAASGGALNVSTLSVARAAIRKQKGIDGNPISLTPKYLVVGPDLETSAEKMVAQVSADSAENVNPFSGRLEVVVTSQIEGKEWYLFADPAMSSGSCFTYGYMQGGAAPRLRTEEAFGAQGVSLSVEHDFGVGAADYRGAFKNPGAN